MFIGIKRLVTKFDQSYVNAADFQPQFIGIEVTACHPCQQYLLIVPAGYYILVIYFKPVPLHLIEI